MYPYYYELEEILNSGLDTVSDFSFMSLVLIVFKIVVSYLVLEKAGERGWKGIIPIYSDYLEYKLYWNKGIFWINLFMPVIILVLGIIGVTNLDNMTLLCVVSVIMVIVSILHLAFKVILKIKKAKCFGEPVLFGVGLILLNTVFCAILAFDKKCQYIGTVEVVEEEPKEEKQEDNI